MWFLELLGHDGQVAAQLAALLGFSAWRRIGTGGVPPKDEAPEGSSERRSERGEPDGGIFKPLHLVSVQVKDMHGLLRPKNLRAIAALALPLAKADLEGTSSSCFAARAPEDADNIQRMSFATAGHWRLVEIPGTHACARHGRS